MASFTFNLTDNILTLENPGSFNKNNAHVFEMAKNLITCARTCKSGGLFQHQLNRNVGFSHSPHMHVNVCLACSLRFPHITTFQE